MCSISDFNGDGRSGASADRLGLLFFGVFRLRFFFFRSDGAVDEGALSGCIATESAEAVCGGNGSAPPAGRNNKRAKASNAASAVAAIARR